MSGVWLALWMVVGCSDPAPTLPEPSVGPPSWDLGAPGAPVLRLLDQVDAAELSLPPSSLPTESPSGVFPLADDWRLASGAEVRGLRLWRTSLPVKLPLKRYMEAPEGMTLRQGDRELPYVRGMQRGARVRGGWEIASGALMLAWQGRPSEESEPIELVYEQSVERESSLNLELSGLSPVDFAHRSVTIGVLTREALLVPAPGSATFQVTVPPGARLRFGYGVAQPPVEGVEATVALSVRVGDDELWSDRASIGVDWREASVDLSKYAGQTVSLRLASDPAGDPLRDYAAFAEPEIIGAPTEAGPRRVVVIGIDTLRPDHLGLYGYDRPTSPGIDALGAQSVVFDQARSPAPRTRPSFRTSTTGRWPYSAIEAPTFGEVLRADGFSTAGVVANVHLSPRLGFADGFGWWQYDKSQDANIQVDRALGWLESHRDEDSFLFLHLMDPHIFYMAPEPFTDRFTSGLTGGEVGDRYNRWMIYNLEQSGKLSDDNKAWLAGRYDGEIAYLDQELVRFVAALDALPGRTLLVLHSDHGEEFWDHGGYEHNHTLYDELVHAALLIRPPGGWGGGPHRVESPVSLADIAPTLYDLAGVDEAAVPEMDGLSLGPLVKGGPAARAQEASLADRPLHVGYLMYDTERWGVVHEGWKYILQTMSGTEELYDLRNDPGERRDLAHDRGVDMSKWHTALEEATGWPVGRGWRVDMRGARQPFSLRFSDPVRDAGVLDPEAGRSRRANLEWGETVPVLPQDVATVTLDEDGRLVRVNPGPHAYGTLYIMGPDSGDRATLREEGEAPRELGPGAAVLSRGNIEIVPGVIIAPKDSEMVHLAGSSDGSEGDDDDAIEALRELGYLE